MTVKVLNREPALDNIRQYGVFDDFTSFTSGYKDFTSIAHDASATVAVDADGQNGKLVLTVDTTDNQEAYVRTTNEVFKMQNNRPVVAIGRFRVGLASANAGAFVFGFMDNPTANAIVDNEGGLAASKYLAAFFMNSGATNAQNLGVMSTSTAAGTYNAASTEVTIDSGWSSYMLTVEPISATEKRICFFYDADGGQNWKQLKDTNGNPIKQKWTVSDPAAGTGELALFCGIKNASTDAQVLRVDYMGAWQLRDSLPTVGSDATV